MNKNEKTHAIIITPQNIGIALDELAERSANEFNEKIKSYESLKDEF